VHGVVDGQGGDAVGACPFGQDRNAKFDSQVGEPAPRIDLDDAGRLLRQQLGRRIRLDFARLDRPQCALDAVDAMRLAVVPFGRDDDPRNRTGLRSIQPCLEKDCLDTLASAPTVRLEEFFI
jgi:hypothetical protein